MPHVPGAYEVDDAYLRARATVRRKDANLGLELLEKSFLAKEVRESTLLPRAVELELQLLKASGLKKRYEQRAKQAELDLAPYR